MTTEVPDRKFNDDKLWKVLDDCTVKLIDESEKERTERMVKECQTEEEILLDQFTDALFNVSQNNSSNKNDANQNGSDSGAIDLTNDIKVEKEPATVIGFDPATMAGDIDLVDIGIGQNKNKEVQIEEEEITSEVKGLGNVKKCAPNQLAIKQDVIAYGKMEVEKLNLCVVCVNKRNRWKRYKNMRADVVHDVANQMNQGVADGNEDSFMELSLGRNQDAIISNGMDN